MGPKRAKLEGPALRMQLVNEGSALDYPRLIRTRETQEMKTKRATSCDKKRVATPFPFVSPEGMKVRIPIILFEVRFPQPRRISIPAPP